ncbi:MAG: metal ABC transporter ATP-binding protein [Saprospiraceae bacterium]|nr:metal ABC transporter ATP-binding protein [Saprospiraceae bacterium]
MSERVISIKDLSVSYERKRVLTNIFLELERGHIYGVIGPNGAGKSTLFKALLGLIEVNTGTILIEGKPVEEMRKRLVYVPQKDEVDWQFPATVLDVVLQGRYPHKKIYQPLSRHDHRLAEEAMKNLSIVHLSNRQIGELSGGQQQRVFLARALCQQAEIFFLDEPFVGVDITTEERIVKILQSLAAEGKTILVIHHDLSNVEAYFDHIILINQRLIASGQTKTTFTPANIDATYRAQLPILHKTGLIE